MHVLFKKRQVGSHQRQVAFFFQMDEKSKCSRYGIVFSYVMYAKEIQHSDGSLILNQNLKFLLNVMAEDHLELDYLLLDMM